jgi:hypothetical protein
MTRTKWRLIPVKGTRNIVQYSAIKSTEASTQFSRGIGAVPLRSEKFAMSATIPSHGSVMANLGFDKPSVFTQNDTSFYFVALYLDWLNLTVYRPKINRVAVTDTQEREDIRKHRFRTLEEIDPYLQEKAKEVEDAWKNQPPTSLSNALAQIRKSLGR